MADEEQPAPTPQPVLGYTVNLALAPKLHPDGKTRQHIALYYSNEAVNLAMDLGPADAAQRLLDAFAPALQGTIDEARQADLGLVTSTKAQMGDVIEMNRAQRRAASRRGPGRPG